MKIAIAFLLVSLNCLCALPTDKKVEPAAPVPKVPQPVPKVPEQEPKPVPKVPEQPQPVPKVPQPVPKVPEQEPKPVPKVPEQPQPVPKVPQPVPKVPLEPQPVPKVPQQPQPVPKVPQQPQPVPKVPQPVPKIDCLEELLKKDAPVLLQNLGNLLCNYKVAQKEQNVALFIAFLNQVNNVLKEVGCSVNNLLGIKVVITYQNAEQLADQVSIILFQFADDIIARVVKILDELPIIGDLMNDGPLSEDLRNIACGVMENIFARVTRIMNIIAEVTGGVAKIIEGL